MNFTLRPAVVAAAAAVALCTTTATRADDTEVFLAQVPPDESGGANILFIIDNSGSMDAELQTQAEWDPATSYTGCYDANALYFATGTEPPPCGSTAFVNKTANRCAAAASPLTNVGRYSDRLLGWNADPSRELWEPLTEGQPERLLECESDRGVDGDGPGANDFAANGPTGPWGPDESQEPGWNSAYTVFDGNWLNWRANPPQVTRTRLQVVQRVINDVLDSVENVNVGLMQFNDEEGGTVIHAVEGISGAREDLKTVVNGMTPLAFTPLSETLYEAALYFRRGNVDYGNVGPVRSVAAARVGGDPAGPQYLSPINVDCQKNFVVLLTDGEPTRDVSANNKIRNLPGFASLLGTCDGAGDGACLDDLAEYLYRTDASSGLAGTQTVSTYVIGFAVDVPLLESTAQRGGGQYYVADDTGSLAAALTDVVTNIVQSAGVFAAPTIPVSAFGQTPDQRDVYVSVFQPTGTAHWPGNLKKYQFRGGTLSGQDGATAINPATGFFAGDAFSFWSTAPDGDRVAEGGAASRIPAPSVRRVYTDLAGPDLLDAGNLVVAGNAAITETMLGVPASQRTALINWIRGLDVLDSDADGNLTEARRQMGDPLHVRPVALNYGATAEDPDTVVFVATNDGFLHAVDADSGVELWTYVPSRLLGRQHTLYLDGPATNRLYGLDGEIRLFRGQIDGLTRSILVFGMGRGGDAVFALDVTARNAPVLLWQIDSTSPGFATLGQTWAAPPIAQVDIGGQVRPVVVLSGGYADSQDNRGLRTDNVGNAIFMVGLESGELLWSAGQSGAGHDLEFDRMRQSIPAAPRVLDLSGDGLADRFYVGDMGGRLWRFDILNGNGRGTLVSGGVLAALGAGDESSAPASEVRRFYATPDVVLVNCLRGTFLALNIGSGYRGHPLDTDVDDAFFSVRDANVYLPVATGDYADIEVDAGDLLDITDDPTATVPVDQAGWRLRMVEDEGEKILNSAITFSNTIFFTSFAPSERVSACSGGLGVNRAYQVDACNGWPVNNLDGSSEPGPLSTDDRFRLLSQTGIAPETVLLLTDNAGTKATECIGLECFAPDPNDPGGASNTFPRTYWTQEIQQ